MSVPIYVRVPMEGERFWNWKGSHTPKGATEQQVELHWAQYNRGLLSQLLSEHRLTESWQVSTPKETA